MSVFINYAKLNFIFPFIAHPSCIEMSQRMFIRSLAYKWQCSHCKSCGKCGKQKDNKMLFCIQCDRGYHIYCLGLRNVPEGNVISKNCIDEFLIKYFLLTRSISLCELYCMLGMWC